jgi:serine/threonine-protein kinase
MGEPRPEPDPLLGEVIASRYQIEVRLGEGAMGVVYRAKHVKVGRAFAVKVLHSRLLDDKKVAERFDREAELAGRLRHPNVIGVVDVGETQGTRYMVMDFAEGHDLATLLGDAPFAADRVISLTRQLCEGLYHAHEQGLIHRDFKPENVIVERDNHGAEVPRIVDFGISILREAGESAQAPGRLTTNGLVLGTPHYMAPEQAVADPIDHRIDLFALGIMMYEMLSGKLPFDGTGAEVARANLMLDPPLISQRVPFLEVEPLLEAMARRLMAKQRDMRPPTAKAARELLDLIERDREAAAAVLGVPLSEAVGTRAPMTTEPLSRREIQPSEPPPMGVPLVAEARTKSGPVATAAAASAAMAAAGVAEAVPVEIVGQRASAPVAAAMMPAHLEADADAAASQLQVPRSLRTELATPLTWTDGAPKRSRAALFGGLAAVGVVAAVLAVALLGGGSSGDGKKVATREPNRVEMPVTQPPVQQPPVQQPPVQQLPVQPEQTPPPVQPEQTPPPADPTPAPPEQAHPQTPTHPVIPPQTQAKHPEQQQQQQQQPKQVTIEPGTTNGSNGSQSPKAADISAGQLGALYQQVGQEITALKAAQGEAAANDLISQFGLISISQEMGAPPARRAEVAASLVRLRREAVSRSHRASR